jgi:hypothetical protein
MWDAILPQNFQEASEGAGLPDGPVRTLLETRWRGILYFTRCDDERDRR